MAAVSVDRPLTIGQAPTASTVESRELTPTTGSWQPVAASADAPDGDMRPFDGGSVVGFVRRVDGRPEAVSGVCTHQGCRLWFDKPDHRLRCPCHSTSFSPAGQVLTHQLPISPEPLPTFMVREQTAPSRCSPRQRQQAGLARCNPPAYLLGTVLFRRPRRYITMPAQHWRRRAVPRGLLLVAGCAVAPDRDHAAVGDVRVGGTTPGMPGMSGMPPMPGSRPAHRRAGRPPAPLSGNTVNIDNFAFTPAR